jgi:8-oxo-dGTP pyrophosphatase MutT (NUDIX family)
MDAVDPFALARTLGRLLRGGSADVPEIDGWYHIDDVAAAAERVLGMQVTAREVARASARAGLECAGDRMRLTPRAEGERPPDVLWCVLSAADCAALSTTAALAGGGQLALHLDEPSAWLAAHAEGAQEVRVLDVARARRIGARFHRHPGTGAWTGRGLPTEAVLDNQRGYAVQVSAGGLPLRWEAGGPRLGLIRVDRRRGSMWEVAKGKLEPGEPPEIAAVREVTEEMGLSHPPVVVAPLGVVHYGFLAPGGLPRLKAVHLFLMEALDDGTTRPAHDEGIADVRWFSPDDACQAVTHPSLTGPMRRARTLVSRRTPPR